MNDYQAFSRDIIKAEKAVKKAENELGVAAARRDRHDRFDIGHAEAEIEHAERVCAQLLLDFKDRSGQIQDLDLQIRDLTAQLRSPYSLRTWIDREQRGHRRALRRAEANRAKLFELNDRDRTETDRLTTRRLELEQKIKAHAAAGREDLHGQVARLERALERQEAALADLRARKTDFEESLRPLFREMDAITAEMEIHQERIDRAADYDLALTLEEDRGERARIHRACQDELGSGKPDHVIQSSNRALDGLERQLAKCHQRRDIEARKARHVIRKLILDGNNMCYEGSGKQSFVRLRPLQALLPRLAEDYEVIVVFDSDIRGLLRAGDAAIRDRLPEEVTVHISAPGTKADPVLFGLANGNPHAFILSNDLYRDYPENRAAQSRVLRYEIVDGRVLVNEIDLSVRFR